MSKSFDCDRNFRLSPFEPQMFLTNHATNLVSAQGRVIIQAGTTDQIRSTRELLIYRVP